MDELSRAQATQTSLQQRLSELTSRASDQANLEEHVIELAGKSSVILEEPEQHFAFVNGSERDYVRYLTRPDLPRGMWWPANGHSRSLTAGWLGLPQCAALGCGSIKVRMEK